jgi:PTS system nitrogen regulatory IIA component
MKIQSILSPVRTFCGAHGTSKKRVLENIAQSICDDISYLDPDDIFENLIAREKLGSTGLGNGIAIPHCRISNCSAVIGSLITLDQSIDFSAIDNQDVDVLFVLLVPEEAHDEHLNVLASLAQRFSDPAFCQLLRQANNNQALYQAAISAD